MYWRITLKTQQEIYDWYKQFAAKDIFGFTGEVLVAYLDYDLAKEFLKPETTKEQWDEGFIPLSEEQVISDMKYYMEFAWGKVRNHRGISAGRSVEKMMAWLWLLDDDELISFIADENSYPMYGAPILKRICEKYNFPIPEGEDIENMSNGLPCCPECEECNL